jgi:GH24 family phage-related lysozyme (muramidase)
MQPSVQQNFLQFTKPLEGTVNYMYLDIKGLVTVGIGNLIDPVGSALALPFVHNSDNSPASQSEIQAEWTKVKNNASLAQQGYKAAAPPFTTLHLPDAAITQLITNKLNANQATVKQTFTGFENWPADAQLGVLSMAWALGAGFASSWPLFKAACLSQNWSSAAQNCQISTTGNPGVAPRNTADVLLFNNAQAVASQELDFSVLHWPNTVAAAPSSGSGSGTGGTSALGSGSGGNGSGTAATGGTAGSAKGAAGSKSSTTTGSSGGAQSTGSTSTTDSGSSDGSTSPITDPGDSSTTGDSTTTGGDSSTSGDDTTTSGDTSSDPTNTSSSDNSGGSDGADGTSDGNSTTPTTDSDATSTSDGSDDSAADPVAVSN